MTPGRAAAAAAAAAALLAPAPASAAFPSTAPDDPLYDASPLPNATNEQWDLASPGGGFDRGISADRAWPLSTGAGVTIADIDVGVDLEHPDLADRFALNPGETGTDGQGRDRRYNRVDDDRNGYTDDWRGYDFYARDADARSDTRNTHGTNVAGVLGAAADNGTGIAGVAPGAAILPIRSADNILHQSGRLAEAITYAADRGAGVMSMSLGADTASSALVRAARYATRRGSVLVAPSGNEFHFHHNFPAVLDEVITVGGLNPDTANTSALSGSLALLGTDFRVRAAYSDYGPHLDVVAPTQVPTTEYGGRYTLTWSGTSATTPHVAGVAALVLSRGRALGLRLSAWEVRQIVNGTAQDQASPSKGTVPGWDRLTGYGRVDAFAAVSRVRPGAIPPEVDITSPSPYQPVNGRRLSVKGLVRGRSPARWALELGQGEEPASWRTIARGGSGTRVRGLATIDPGGLAAAGYTLRLRATDSRGNTGEDRAFFFSLRDRTLKRGYPKRLGSSGESSPQLADLNGDGRTEIVVAGSDGRLNVLSGRTGRRLRGWPRTMARYGSRTARKRLGTLRQGFAATPAVGNIVGGRRLEVVAAGLDGRVYAWTPRGRRVRGFPVRIGLRKPGSDGKLDSAIYASPALADLDRDGKLDVVVGAADQRLYAWNGRGRRLRGWPVLARDPAGGDVAKILSSPAVGDVDGDGSPDVVEGTAEAYGTTPNTTGRVYAFSARGRLLAGWPVKPEALAADGIPLAGEGVPMSPSLADVDGDGRDEVAVTAFTGRPELFRGDGTRMARPGEGNHFQALGRGASSPASSPAGLAIGANAAFGHTVRGGPLRLFGGLIDLRLAQAQVSPASRVAFEHLLGGWDARSGDWLPAFPRPLEGWTILSGPAVVDVDGDGRAEAVAGSSGYRLHAFGESGREPPGWPKQTGGWLIAAPAVGDVDGDRRLEVVAVTREGWLFAWNTPSPRTALREWPVFRHDRRNSGRLP